MNQSKKITLVICTYNRDKYLQEALDSILRQTADDNKFQLIIVDNRSTDTTALIAKTFLSNNPRLNIKYAFETNKGLSFARNRGIKEADGEIICYVDDDAILSPSYVQEMISFFESFPNA